MAIFHSFLYVFHGKMLVHQRVADGSRCGCVSDGFPTDVGVPQNPKASSISDTRTVFWDAVSDSLSFCSAILEILTTMHLVVYKQL